MRLTLTTAFKNYLANRVVKTMARFWRIQLLNGTMYGYTTHTRDIVYNGETYQSILGLTSSASQSQDNLSPDNVVVTAFLSQAIEADIIAGRYDHAYVEIFLLNYYDLSMDRILEKTGYLGEITIQDVAFQVEKRGLAQALITKVGRLYSASCDARVGDRRCSIPLTPLVVTLRINVDGSGETLTSVIPSVDFRTLGFIVGRNVTISGSSAGNNLTVPLTNVAATVLTTSSNLTTENNVRLTLTQSNPYFLSSTITSSPGPQQAVVNALSAFADGWFTQGLLRFTSGDNADVERDVKFHSGTTLYFYEEFPFTIDPGDAFELTAGCIKTIEICNSKFANTDNFRGFPYAPTNDTIFSSPVNSGQTIS